MLQTDTNSKIKKRMCPSEDEDDTDDNSDISASDMDNSNFNPGWADAMSKVLRMKSKKLTILKKAKKDSEIVEKAKKDIEIVNEKGELITEISKEKKQDDYSCYQHEKKLFLEQKQKKLLWINMCRTKPDISEKQKERALNRIATRGVVQLFNAVRQHQKTLGEKLSTAGNSEVKKEKVIKSFTKGGFLDRLKNKEKKSEESKNDENSHEKEKKWDVLRDNFMMEATLKDWDKDSDEDK
ncbi:RRP15-like protein [Centruroides vittatus]|uniref:RRP15-like protein n=1 Tax=Centruroides vittatus TaxID=120091 RepID=UPI00350EA324